MIVKLCGGEPSKAKIAGHEPVQHRVIAFDFARVEKLSGVKVPDAQIKDILEALGCTVAGKPNAANVTVPTWRPDMHGSADLVEEVVRIAGLDRIPATPLPRIHGISKAVLTAAQKRSRRARRLLAARGLVEAVTWSFITREEARHFGGGSDTLELANPISSELSSMRPGLIPGLLSGVTRNRNRGVADVALFELGQAYRGDKPEDQYLSAAGVRAGTAQLAGSGRQWQGAGQNASLFDVKADVFATLAALGFDPAKAQITRDAPAYYHPGRSGAVKLGPKTVLAYFGEVHPKTLSAFGVAAPVAAFEIFLDAIPAEKKKSRAKPALSASDLLPVTRDFAFIVARDVAAGDIIKAAANAQKALIHSVQVFDLFEGGTLAAEGKKSLGLEVTLQPQTETLTDAAIEAIGQKIIADVKKATGGDIRG